MNKQYGHRGGKHTHMDYTPFNTEEQSLWIAFSKGGMVPAGCVLSGGTVPPWCVLSGGTVPPGCVLSGETVPPGCVLSGGTVPPFNLSLKYNQKMILS